MMTTSTPILDQYLASLDQQQNRHGHPLAPATIRATASDLRGFARWWEATKRVTFDPALVRDRDLVQWQIHRQTHDGARPSTINRATASLRGFFGWAQRAGQIGHNPAAALHDRPVPEVAPRGISPDGMAWLLRLASATPDPHGRLRDLALLTLLYECGLRREEACTVQLRDLDFGGGILVVRDGKGGVPGRVLLTRSAGQWLREYLRGRVPHGLPPIGSDAERAPLLERRAVTVAGQPWLPGMSAAAIHARIGALGRAAAAYLHDQAKREPDSTRVRQLTDLAIRLEHVTPHQLRHGLAYRLRQNGQDAAYIQRALRHTRASTSLKYGKPTDDAVRQALEESEQAGR